MNEETGDGMEKSAGGVGGRLLLSCEPCQANTSASSPMLMSG